MLDFFGSLPAPIQVLILLVLLAGYIALIIFETRWTDDER